MLPASLLLRQEFRTLYPGGRSLPPVVALAAYFDESKNRDTGILTIAGYLGPVDMWDLQFTPRWREVLSAAPHPVTEFKASDCRNGRGEFAGWTRQERDDLTSALVSTIVDEPQHQLMGLGASVILDYSRITTKVLKKKLERFAHLWCAALAVRMAFVFGGRQVQEDHFQVVFDEEKHMMHRITSVFDLARGLFAKEWGHRVRMPIFLPSHEAPALQAADLLAFETYTAMVHMTTKAERPPSKALMRLLRGRYHIGQYFLMSDMFDHRRRFEAGELTDEDSFKFSTLYDSIPKTPPSNGESE